MNPTPKDSQISKVFEIIKKRHQLRQRGFWRMDTPSNKRYWQIFGIPLAVLFVFAVLTRIVPNPIFQILVAIGFIVYWVVAIIGFFIISILPEVRELFFQTLVYLDDAEKYAHGAETHVRALKTQPLEALSLVLMALRKYRETTDARSKLLMGVTENLGLFPAVGALLVTYGALLVQYEALVNKGILPSTFNGSAIIGTGLLFFASIFLMLYSRRMAMTNTLFDETCLERAIEELEDEQKPPKP